MALYSPLITNFWKFYNPKANHYNIYTYSTMNDSISFKDMIVLKAYCDQINYYLKIYTLCTINQKELMTNWIDEKYCFMLRKYYDVLISALTLKKYQNS